MDSPLFLEKSSHSLVCCICHSPAYPPKQCRHGHLFCEGCIERWLSIETTCPVDRAKLSLSDLAENLLAKEMISKMPVACPHGDPTTRTEATAVTEKKSRHEETRTLFCTWQGPLEALEAHLAKDCGFQSVHCPNQGCDAEFKRHELLEHEQKCPYAPIGCLTCSGIFLRRDEKIHFGECPNRVVSCDACGIWQGIFKDFQLHTNTCPKAMVTCGLCKTNLARELMDEHLQKNLSSHFAVLIQAAQQVKELTDANAALTRDVIRLENTCNSMTTTSFSELLPPSVDGWRSFTFRVPDSEQTHHVPFIGFSRDRCLECGEPMCRLGFTVERVRPQEALNNALGRWIGVEMQKGHLPVRHAGRLHLKFEIFQSANSSLPVLMAFDSGSLIYEAGRGICHGGKFGFMCGQSVPVFNRAFVDCIGPLGALHVNFYVKYEDVAP